MIIEEDGQETPVYTLREVIEFLRVNGRKGIEIQRYKGSWRDERRSAVGNHDGSGKTHAA